MTIVLSLATFNVSLAQINLLDTSTWTTGNGSVTGFTAYGAVVESIREMDITPHGDQNVVWKAIPDGVSSGSNGGWTTDRIPISPSKTYRLTVWMKKQNSHDGSAALASNIYDNNSTNNMATKLDGAPVTNLIFVASSMPELDQWYLFVGYVHPSTYTETVSLGGIYAMDGVKVINGTDYKFLPNAITLTQRAYLWSGDNPSDTLFLYGPTIYEVNGQEPTIEAILQGPSSPESHWTQNGSILHYTEGNVGIGTQNPGSYRLAVNGSIHAKEVKVDMNGWADYVFAEGYRLPSLEEVKNHIDENGHLINLPSSKEVLANGISLGEMNRLLLEKIEELTLYMIDLKEEIKVLKSDNPH